jgi:hypothetical protein
MKVKLVGTDAVVRSVGNDYARINKLDATYVQPATAKDTLLRPTVIFLAAGTTIWSSLLRLPDPPPPPGQQRLTKTLHLCMSNYNNRSVAAAPTSRTHTVRHAQTATAR